MVFAYSVSLFGLGQTARAQEGATTEIAAKRLPTPPTVATLAKSASPAKTRLVPVSRSANQITDDEAWFIRNGLKSPDLRFGTASPEDYGDLPRGAALTYKGTPLRRALNTANAGANRFLGLYGDGRGQETYLVSVNGFNGDYLYALDFANYRSPAGSSPDYARQAPQFAYEDKDGTLYISNGISGYAKEAKGKTGYVTALNPKTGQMLWRSGPLTQNANTFADAGDVLVCGYGFTAEPDFVYVLDKRTGRKVQAIPVKSGPLYIIRKGERVYVRCYDTDYVFAIRR
jgi:hypothetical protein